MSDLFYSTPLAPAFVVAVKNPGRPGGVRVVETPAEPATYTLTLSEEAALKLFGILGSLVDNSGEPSIYQSLREVLDGDGTHRVNIVPAFSGGRLVAEVQRRVVENRH